MPFGLRGRGKKRCVAGLCLALAGTSLVGCSASPSEDLERAAAPIIGGKLDTSHKGVVSLLRAVQGGYVPSCSGTLLTRNLVLTAHHCVAELNSQDGQSVECESTTFKPPIRASSLLVSIEANVGREGLDPYGVAEIWLPPDAGDAICGKDIALLRLSGTGVPPEMATPIEPRISDEIAENDEFLAIGYGLQDPDDLTGETAGQRMSAGGASVFCAGAACDTDIVQAGEWIAESPVCSGDSGGPALDEGGRVAGVTSRGDAACTIGIYTSVYAWRDFIKDKTFEAADEGNYQPPTWAGDPPPGFDPGVPSGGSGGSGGKSSGGNGGQPSAGGSLAIAGGSNPAAGGGGAGTGSPTIDPLGSSCTGQCPGDYLCWAESGKPPRLCVPRCNESNKSCPGDYTCDTGVGVCVPQNGLSGPADGDSSGCGVARGAPSSPLALAGLSLLGSLLIRRRRR